MSFVIEEVISICVGTLVIVAITICITATVIQGRMERRAIENNVAEYVVDSKTGNVTFQYINPVKNKD